MAQRRFQPPPTRYGPSSLQAKTPPVAIGTVPPPPTRFAPGTNGPPRTAVGQTKVAGGTGGPPRLPNPIPPPHYGQAATVQRWAAVTGIAGGLATGLLAGAAAPGILAGLGLAAVTEMGVRAAGGRGSLIDMASRCLNRPDYSGVSTHDDLEMNAPSGITIDAPNRLDFSKSNSIGRGAQKVFYPGKATGCWGFRTKTRWCVASSRAMNEAIETEANALKGIAAVGGIRVTSVLDEGYTVDGCYAYLRQDIDGTASKGEDKANFMHALFNLSQSAKATAKADLERLRAFLERHTIGDLQVIVTNQGHIWVFDPNGFQKGKAMDHAARQIGLWLNNLDVKPNIPPGKVGRD